MQNTPLTTPKTTHVVTLTTLGGHHDYQGGQYDYLGGHTVTYFEKIIYEFHKTRRWFVESKINENTYSLRYGYQYDSVYTHILRKIGSINFNIEITTTVCNIPAQVKMQLIQSNHLCSQSVSEYCPCTLTYWFLSEFPIYERLLWI